jgi:hypothetical protein
MRDDLGIGLAFKDMALGGQLGLQLGKVLDDAVVDQGDASGLVRVGVDGCWGTVGGPARVADPNRGVQRCPDQYGLEIADLALGAATFGHAADQSRDAGRIIAAVLKPFETVDQPGGDRTVPGHSNNAAHG